MRGVVDVLEVSADTQAIQRLAASASRFTLFRGTQGNHVN